MCGVDSRLLSLSTFRRLRKSARSPGLTKSEKVPAPAGKPKAAVLAAMATFQLFPAKSYGICTISSFSSPSMSLKRTACGDERVRRVWRMEAHHIERPHLGTELEHMTAANIRADFRHAECSKSIQCTHHRAGSAALSVVVTVNSGCKKRTPRGSALRMLGACGGLRAHSEPSEASGEAGPA